MDVARAAIRLATNPLGIIALFLVVAYAIAAHVLGGGTQLPEDSRRVLVWFIVSFPVLMLFVFSFLVVFWHTHLYAPGDFRDESIFADLASAALIPPAAQRERLANEVEEQEAAQPPASIVLGSAEAQSKDQSQVAETKPPRSPKSQVMEESRNRAFLAVELAIRKLEAEWNVRINRQVRFGDVGVDGAATVGPDLRVVEVKLTHTIGMRAAEMGLDQLERIVRRTRHVTDRVFPTFRGVITGYLVIVLGDETKDPVATGKRITKLLRESRDLERIEVIVYSLDALAREFGVAV